MEIRKKLILCLTIQPLSGKKHLKIQLIKRFVQFHKTLTKCDKPHLRYLAKLQEVDHRSVFGRNIINICKEAKVEKICDVNIDTFEYFPISEEEEWKVPFMVELLEMLAGKLFFFGFPL